VYARAPLWVKGRLTTGTRTLVRQPRHQCSGFTDLVLGHSFEPTVPGVDPTRDQAVLIARPQRGPRWCVRAPADFAAASRDSTPASPHQAKPAASQPIERATDMDAVSRRVRAGQSHRLQQTAQSHDPAANPSVVRGHSMVSARWSASRNHLSMRLCSLRSTAATNHELALAPNTCPTTPDTPPSTWQCDTSGRYRIRCQCT
jgi:hypothetical protein